jgi:hypothetical protein
MKRTVRILRSVNVCHPGAPEGKAGGPAMDRAARAEELNELLDRLSYEVTAARSAGVDRPLELRRALKSIGKIAADIDALAVTEVAARQKD